MDRGKCDGFRNLRLCRLVIISFLAWTAAYSEPELRQSSAPGIRREEGGKRVSDVISLPAPATSGQVSVEAALSRRRSIREFTTGPLRLEEVGQLLWAAQGVTSPEGLRTAPSAGATYPLETYLLAGNVLGLDPGLYRYDPMKHVLVPHVSGDRRSALAAACLSQSWVREAPASIVLGAVFDRTTTRYGKRGVQYVHMEVGHAAQNVYLQATASGLGTVIVGAFDDDAVGRCLQLPPGVVPLAVLPLGRPVDTRR